MLFLCAVMMCRALKALKCLSHSAEDAGITKIRRAMSESNEYFSVLWPHHFSGSNCTDAVWCALEFIEGRLSLSYALISSVTFLQWVMGHWAVTHDPSDPSNFGDPFDPLTHGPLTHCQLWTSRPIQSCWYGPAYSAGSPTWHQGHALFRPVWPPRHRHGYPSQVLGVSRALSACRTKSILSYQNSVEVGGLSTIRELIRHSSRSWGDRHPSPGGLSCREAGCHLHIDGIWSGRTSRPVGPPCNRRKFEVQQPILEELQTSVYVDQNPRCQLETFVSVPRNMTSSISGRHGSFRITLTSSINSEDNYNI